MQITEYLTPRGRTVRNIQGQWQMLGDKGWINLKWVPANLKKKVRTCEYQ